MSTPNSLISCFVHTILRDSQNVHQNSLAFATSGHQARDVAGGAAGPSRLRRRAHWGCCCGGAAVLPSVTAHQRRCRVRRRARAASRDTLEGPGGWARHATRAVAGAGFPFTALARIFWQYVTKWFRLSNPSPLTDPSPSAACPAHLHMVASWNWWSQVITGLELFGMRIDHLHRRQNNIRRTVVALVCRLSSLAAAKAIRVLHTTGRSTTYVRLLPSLLIAIAIIITVMVLAGGPHMLLSTFRSAAVMFLTHSTRAGGACRGRPPCLTPSPELWLTQVVECLLALSKVVVTG